MSIIKAVLLCLCLGVSMAGHLHAKDWREMASQKQSEQDSSSELSAKEKALLDSFMQRLKQEPDAVGSIRIDRERRRVDEPELTNLVTRYLQSKYGSEMNRVEIIGAYRLSQEMELFVVPRGGTREPIPFPTTHPKKCS